MKRQPLALLLALAAATAAATEPNAQPEAVYADTFCAAQGGARHRLQDRLEVDCLTDSIAWEVDHAPAYAGCIGQALLYSVMTGREPGCALIIEEPSDCRYYERLWAALARVREPFHVQTIGETCP